MRHWLCGPLAGQADGSVLCPHTGAPGASSSGGSSRGSFDAERHAARMAVQAAAGALMSLTAGICDDIVMSSHTRLPGDNVDNDDGISTRVRFLS